VLFCALLAAGEIGKAKCGVLSIECRSKTEDKMTFLIKEGSEVVAQLPVSVELLSKQRNPIRKYLDTDLVKCFKPDVPEGKIFSRIEDLKVGMKNVNLKAEVLDVSKPKRVMSRLGNQIRLAKALLKDETGEIKLCLWKEDVEAVSKGDQIEIENAKVTKFAGVKQLTIGSKSTLKIINKTSEDDHLLKST
jgi:replication factor A1